MNVFKIVFIFLACILIVVGVGVKNIFRRKRQADDCISKYGTDIDTILRWDGKNNCSNDSEEKGSRRNTVKRSPIISPLQNNSNRNNCLLPPHPENGKWITLLFSTLKPGEAVAVSTVLAFSCNVNYTLVPDITLSLCLPDWTVIPKCIRTCPSLIENKNITVSCSHNTKSISCDRPFEGTKAIIKCADDSPTIYCRDGSWDNSIPNCKPAHVTTDINLTSTKFAAGKNTTLPCTVVGYPIPKIQWYKDNMLIEESERMRISDGSHLVITNPEEADSGQYKCEAYNQYSRSESSIGITFKEIPIDPNCVDNAFFANCKLIVQARYCHHGYYKRFCCRSCTEAGLLP